MPVKKKTARGEYVMSSIGITFVSGGKTTSSLPVSIKGRNVNVSFKTQRHLYIVMFLLIDVKCSVDGVL